MLANSPTEDQMGVRRGIGLGVWLLGCLVLIPLVGTALGWGAALILMLLALVPLFFLLPEEARRSLALAYLFYLVVVSAAFYLNGQIGPEGRWHETIQSSPTLRVVMGSYEMQMVWSILGGLVAGLLLVGLPLFLIVFVSAEGVLALSEEPDLTRGEALRLVATAVLGLGPVWMVIDEGKIVESKPKGLLPKLGGPGLVVIQEGNAAVFQKSGRITQVAGPGKTFTEYLERPRCVLDLTPQWKTLELENVRTRDHIPLEMTVGVGYRIEPREETDKRRGEGQDPDGDTQTRVLGQAYPVYEGVVRKAAFRPAGEWYLTAVGIVENTLRDVVATYPFDDIFRHAPGDAAQGRMQADDRTVRAIEKAVLASVRPLAAREFGISISTVDIRAVALPKDVQERLLEWWCSRWESEIKKIQAGAEQAVLQAKGIGQALALKEVEGAKREALQGMVEAVNAMTNLAEKNTVLAAHVTNFILGLVDRMVADDVIAMRMLETLEKASEGKGDLRIYLGGQGFPLLGLAPDEGERRRLPSGEEGEGQGGRQSGGPTAGPEESPAP